MLKKFIFPSLLLMSVVISGCSSTKNSNESANNFTGPDRGRVIGNDVTNQNPNFLNLRGTRNGNTAGNSQSIGRDVDMAKQVIRGTHEFTPDSVWTHGSRMYVTVNKKGTLTGRERKDAETRLYKKLRLALPRYDITVNVH